VIETLCFTATMSSPVPTPVNSADFEAVELSDWTWRDGGSPALVAGFLAADYTGAAAFALQVAGAADEAGHHPDIDVRYPRHCRVVLTTHETGGVSDLDLQLATRISALAAEHSVGAEANTPR